MARSPNTSPPIAALKDVKLADGPVMLFDGVDLALQAGVRACLVGRNGAGKSTLMRVLSGVIDPDGGERFLQPGITTANVPQEPEIVGETVLDHAMAGGADHWKAEAELEAFGLDPAKSTKGMSGGEIRRAALARAFAEEPDLMLLDEPTNHLDITAIETLEQRLKTSKAAALIVSHDRAFLERTTKRSFWLAHRKVRTLDAGFAEFDAFAEAAEAEESERLRRLEKTIEREAYTFQRSITGRRTRNEGRARSLDQLRLQKAAILKDQTRPLEMAIDAGGMTGKLVAQAKGVSKRFGEKVIAANFSTRILRGDRVAIVGPNGAGKTTMVKLLLGQLDPDDGEVKLGTNLEIAYLDQSRASLKDTDTLWETLTPAGGDSIMVRGFSRHVAGYAKDFLFRDNQLRQPVSTLSGGERNRLLLAKALANPANLMILDEPTNDLDMETLDLLEDLLADYTGTLILVSHDRDFIDRLATSTIALDGRGNAVETPGGWTDFKRQNPHFLDVRSGDKGGKPAPAPVSAPKKPGGKLSFKDQHRLGELEALTRDLPGKIRADERRLEDPAFYARDPKGFDSLMAKLTRARAELAKAEEEWLALEEKREALAG